MVRSSVLTGLSKSGMLLTCFLSCSLLMSQTPAFSIVGKTTNPSAGELKLDATLNLTYTVLLSGGVNLTNTVPKLEVDSQDQNVIDRISATWSGTTALSNWQNGEGQDFSFTIHLYNDSAMCQQGLDFKLSFLSDQNTTPIFATANNPNTALHFNVGTSPALVLERQLSTIGGTVILIPGQPNLWVYAPDLSVPPGNIRDSNKRIVLYADWDFNGAPIDQVFNVLLMRISRQDLCEWWNLRTQLWPNPANFHYTGPVIDQTLSTPTVVTQQGLTRGVNIFDVTNALSSSSQSQCNTTLQNAINFTPGGTGSWEIANIFGFTGSLVRKLDFYLASTENCYPATTFFGTTPSSQSFHLTNFSLKCDGSVIGALTVPSAWKSGNQLAAGFDATWFLRTQNSVISLGSSGRNLSMEASSGLLNPDTEDYYLEVHIARTVSGSTSVVSVDNQGEPNQSEICNCFATLENAQDAVRALYEDWPNQVSATEMVSIISSVCP